MRWDTFLAVEFWALVTMATLLASAVATGFAWWARWRSRPEVDWAPVPGKITEYSQADGIYRLPARLMAVGDGHAFRVAIVGSHCEASLKGEPEQRTWGEYRPDIPLVPIVAPGDECPMVVRCAVGDWDQAELVITHTPLTDEAREAGPDDHPGTGDTAGAQPIRG